MTKYSSYVGTGMIIVVLCASLALVLSSFNMIGVASWTRLISGSFMSLASAFLLGLVFSDSKINPITAGLVAFMLLFLIPGVPAIVIGVHMVITSGFTVEAVLYNIALGLFFVGLAALGVYSILRHQN